MKIRVVRTRRRARGDGRHRVRTVLRLIDGLFLYLVGLIVMLVDAASAAGAWATWPAGR